MHDLEVANLQDEVERLKMENRLLEKGNARILELQRRNRELEREINSIYTSLSIPPLTAKS
jgi:hypothetical protein